MYEHTQTNIHTTGARDGPLQPLMATLGIHQNIHVCDTKQMSSLGIDYISSPLVMDKLIPINSRLIMSPPKLSLLLEVVHTPAVIIKIRLILVTHIVHLRTNCLTSRDGCSFNTSTGLSALLICQDRSFIEPAMTVQSTLCFRNAVLLTAKTQVRGEPKPQWGIHLLFNGILCNCSIFYLSNRGSV